MAVEIGRIPQIGHIREEIEIAFRGMGHSLGAGAGQHRKQGQEQEGANRLFLDFLKGLEQEINLAQVQIGDIVVVYPGDQIPVDGEVVSGIGLVDQHKLTGESVPITREAGQDVLAATLVVDGTMRIETKRTGNNTRAGVVVALMESAPVHDTRMEDYARKVGDRIVIPTLALGAVTTAASAGNIIRGVSVITFDVGTGVRVSVPTARDRCSRVRAASSRPQVCSRRARRSTPLWPTPQWTRSVRPPSRSPIK